MAETNLTRRGPYVERECTHPPQRVYAWAARDDRVPGGRVMCAACCDCGKVLAGGAGADDA